MQLEVDKDVRPVQQPLRRVPEAMRKPLKEHLDDLEAKSVIEKVERPTEWVNSVVIARKANGKLRLCLDPKPLNKALKRSQFPMPVIEDILPELGKAKMFTKVDCKDGYWQGKLLKVVLCSRRSPHHSADTGYPLELSLPVRYSSCAYMKQLKV